MYACVFQANSGNTLFAVNTGTTLRTDATVSNPHNLPAVINKCCTKSHTRKQRISSLPNKQERVSWHNDTWLVGVWDLIILTFGYSGSNNPGASCDPDSSTCRLHLHRRRVQCCQPQALRRQHTYECARGTLSHLPQHPGNCSLSHFNFLLTQLTTRVREDGIFRKSTPDLDQKEGKNAMENPARQTHGV